MGRSNIDLQIVASTIVLAIILTDSLFNELKDYGLFYCQIDLYTVDYWSIEKLFRICLTRL